MDITVVIATFGDDRWRELAQRRAVPSAEKSGAPVVIHHGGNNIAEARNIADREVETEWVCHLDADDELEPGYIEAMGQAIANGGDLFAPALREVTDGVVPDSPLVLKDRDMDHLNPCAVGTVLRTEMIRRCGGWWDERAWEDWSLFRRAWLLGAKITHVPDAVYRTYVDPCGRNSTVTNPVQLSRAIRNAHRRWLRARKPVAAS